MHKFLFPVKNYVYKACNPPILNFSIIKKIINFELLDYRPKISYMLLLWVCYLYVYFVVTSTDFLVIVWFLFDWV
jgi:hypothetical protein